MKEGEVLRFAPFGYSATRSHRFPSCSQQSGNPCRTCCFNSLEIKCPLSQYCEARWSDIRDRTSCVGLCQSVGRIGSQITKTRTCWLEFCFNHSSIAEAPRTHVVQVGESRATIRVWSAAALNSASNCLRFSGFNMTNAACPFGVRWPSSSQPARTSSTTPIPAIMRFRFLVIQLAHLRAIEERVVLTKTHKPRSKKR